MAILRLGRTFSLKPEIVKKLVNSKPGVYLLGNLRRSNQSINRKFFPRYVGSSYTDLKREIIQQGFSLKRKENRKSKKPKYSHFKFSHLPNTPIKAFKKECEIYHSYINSLENQRHPKKTRRL
jgi:hypothetical protein